MARQPVATRLEVGSIPTGVFCRQLSAPATSFCIQVSGFLGSEGPKTFFVRLQGQVAVGSGVAFQMTTPSRLGANTRCMSVEKARP